MKFTISREALLKPLQLVAGVVERRQTLPVLSNILLVVEGNQLSMTGTDLEVEMVGRIELEQPAEPGSITVPAKKLMDICKSLPDQRRYRADPDWSEGHHQRGPQPLHAVDPAGDRIPECRRRPGESGDHHRPGRAQAPDRPYRFRDGAAGCALLPERHAAGT